MDKRVSHLWNLLDVGCSELESTGEVERDYQNVGASSPYHETMWGKSSHEAMMRDKQCQIADKHRGLNRFSNILPFDRNLVSCSKGYINASHVVSVGRSFLIAQGPKIGPDTREAFWHVVVEHNVQLMVNLAPFGPECADYLHESPFGDVKVEILDQQAIEPPNEDSRTASSQAILRNLRITLPGKSPHEVEHIQFDHWPNYGMPYKLGALAKVAKVVMTKRLRDNAEVKTLINCSGGVGRSGAFVALIASCEHMMLLAGQGAFDKFSAKQDSITPFSRMLREIVKESVESIRDQRHPWLVEGVGQYNLIFQTLGVLARIALRIAYQ